MKYSVSHIKSFDSFPRRGFRNRVSRLLVTLCICVVLHIFSKVVTSIINLKDITFWSSSATWHYTQRHSLIFSAVWHYIKRHNLIFSAAWHFIQRHNLIFKRHMALYPAPQFDPKRSNALYPAPKFDLQAPHGTISSATIRSSSAI